MPALDPIVHPANISSEIENFLKEGKTSEAASYAIALLSTDIDDMVGAGLFVLPKY